MVWFFKVCLFNVLNIDIVLFIYVFNDLIDVLADYSIEDLNINW